MVLLHLIHHPAGTFRIKALQGIAILTEFGQSHWHHSHRLSIGLSSHNILNGSIQLRPIIQIPTQNNLSMILHIGSLQLFQLAHEAVCGLAPQHLLPQLRIGTLYRNKQRGKMILLNALKIPVHHIGQGNEIAIQKGHAVVIILNIQTIPHIGSYLVHKAEIAVIGTMSNAVKNSRFKLYPQLLVIILVKLQKLLLAIFMLHQHLYLFTGKGKADIYNIPQLHAIDFQNLISRNQLQLLCQTPLRYCQYFTIHFHCLLYLLLPV